MGSQGSLAKTSSRGERPEEREAAAAPPPPRGTEQIEPTTASPPRATRRPLKASLRVVEVALAGRQQALLLSRQVLGEWLEARVHKAVGMGSSSRWMTATPPGGGLPSTSRAPVLTGICPVAAGRDQKAPTAADTGPPATRETAARTQGDDPSAPMVPAGPPAPVPCLDALAAPGAAPPCTTRLLAAPPLVPVTRGILLPLQRRPAPTAAGQLAALLPPLACRQPPAWEQS